MSDQFITPTGYIGIIDSMRQIVIANGKSVVTGQPLELSGPASVEQQEELADPYWLYVGTYKVLTEALRTGRLTAFTAGGAAQISPRYWMSALGNESLMTGCCHDAGHDGQHALLSIDQFTQWLSIQQPSPRDSRLHFVRDRDTASPRKRGPKSTKTDRVSAEMLAAIIAGEISADQLSRDTEETLAELYKVSRDTARKARSVALSQFLMNNNSDK